MKILTALLIICIASSKAMAGDLDFFGGYMTVEGIYEELNSIAINNPNIAELNDYGDSYVKSIGGLTTPDGDNLPGYDLLAMRITNKNIQVPKPAFILIAELHAREIASPEIAMRFLRMLVEDYGNDPDVTWIVDNRLDRLRLPEGDAKAGLLRAIDRAQEGLSL